MAATIDRLFDSEQKSNNVMKPAIFRLKTISIAFGLLVLTLAAISQAASAQTVVDKTVASVGDGVGEPQLITYSDLLWQLALEPDAPLDPPTSEDLNRTLQTLINQRLFAIEAERVPQATPTEAETNAEIKRVLAQFPSTAEFEKRLRLVGFDSVKDENFVRIMAQRVAIVKYTDFRFRSFVVITPVDEEKYFREVYTPEFRRLNPGRILPSLDEKRAEINTVLTEEKVAGDIERFLDFAKRRSEIIVLSEV